MLRIGATGNYPEIKIDENNFELLKSSKKILDEAIALEEKFEILITNYLELEKEFINIAVSEMVRYTNEYREFFVITLMLNVRIINLLTSVRLYIDTLASHLSICSSSVADIKGQTKKLFEKEYDDNFEYRFMETFRNHVQHSGIPVHYTSVGSYCTDLDKDKGLKEYSLYYSARKEKLISSKSFKRSVLKEMPDEVNLCNAIRKYIESISSIHEQARKMINCNIAEARRVFEEAITSYKSEYDGSIIGLKAYKYKDNQVVDEVFISLKWDDVRLYLVRKNRQLINLSKRYATSQAREKNKIP